MIYAVMLVLFATVIRHRLVLSPEEEYAMSGGLDSTPHADPSDA